MKSVHPPQGESSRPFFGKSPSTLPLSMVEGYAIINGPSFSVYYDAHVKRCRRMLIFAVVNN